ncbi:MAG: chromosomal replication initiator protein DnaA [Bacteroidaceae bacterium]|nr:chromosomal replication initiator protein DnaA [Bacteroidaceae bacterium]MBQ8565754.1 chromosomal replication initiator protein DnaA [Bacteroidaceae bacterium]MBQ8734581.1 chromosomal replication initiator protein DnaA [Bacteroidaceae bacterium]
MDSHLNTLWDNCLRIIRDNVSASVFSNWFADIVPLEYKNKTLNLQVKSHFVCEFLEENYLDLLSATFNRVLGEGVGLVYTIVADKTNGLTTEVEADTLSVKQPNKAESVEELNSMLITKYTFDNYVEGISNKLSRTAAESVAMFPGKTFNPLFIHGASGVGKTHLVNAIGTKIKQLHPELRVLYVSAHLFQVQYTDSILHKNFNDFMRFYQSIDILIIDDIQEFAGLPGTQNAFFHIFNHLHLNGKQLIMTSDRSPAQMKGMEERLITRFKWGLSAEIEKPDLELRKNILRSKVRRDGLNFPEEVISYIAENVNASVRDLEGIVVSLMAHSTIHNCDISLQLARKVLGGISEYEKEPIGIEKIIKTVADYYNVEVDSVNTKSRKREIVLVRQTAMYLAKKHLDLSTSKIGYQIGRRDHATVLHACKTIANLLETDKQYRGELSEIEAALQIA